MPWLRCGVCRRRFDSESPTAAAPFCGQRCRMIDMKRWLGEEYGLPYTRSDDELDDELADGPASDGESSFDE